MSDAIAEAVSQLATKADIAAVKVGIAATKAELEAAIELLKRDMTIRLGIMMIVAVGIILAGVAALLRLLH